MVEIRNSRKIKNMLDKIAKEMSCKTVLDTIDNLIGNIDVSVQVYSRDIVPVTYVIVYDFNRFNKLRLVIKKVKGDINYNLTLYSSHNDLSKEDECYTEKIDEKNGNREAILGYLKDNGLKFIEIVKNNNCYIYAVRYLINYAIKIKMNRINLLGYIETKYNDGLYLIYKDRWITEEEGYKNMYCFQGYGDKLRIINSLVIQNNKGELTKLNEDIVYDGPVTDLKTAWNKMKYVVYESKEEKELVKKLKKNK